jgi:hypothetical protein
MQKLNDELLDFNQERQKDLDAYCKDIDLMKRQNNELKEKYQDVLSLSNRQIWAMVALAAVSLISLSLYFSSL